MKEPSLGLESILFSTWQMELDELGVLIKESPFRDDMVADLQLAAYNAKYLLQQIGVRGCSWDVGA
jgi:hypothetical protein